MKQQITFRQYRAMDLFLFTALLCVCETLITLGATRWFPREAYTLSITPAVTAIVMVRWGVWAAIPAGMGALAFGLASGGSAAQALIYCVGSMAALALAPLLRRIGWKRLHENVLLTMLYGLVTALLMQLGRGVMALLLGHTLAGSLAFIATDALSALFAVILVWIARRLDGVLEEQKHYLKRVAEEMEKERNAHNGMME